MVAPKKYIAIVDIAGQCLALGITDHTITRLADLGPEAKAMLTPLPSARGAGSVFAGLLHKSMQSWRQDAPGQGGNEATPKSTNAPEESP